MKKIIFMVFFSFAVLGAAGSYTNSVCNSCRGTGYVTCNSCHGSGAIGMDTRRTCMSCRGSGIRGNQYCSSCSGKDIPAPIREWLAKHAEETVIAFVRSVLEKAVNKLNRGAVYENNYFQQESIDFLRQFCLPQYS